MTTQEAARMKIALITDAWRPQINGVVTTLGHTRTALEAMGHEVQMFTPLSHRTLPCPTYPEIRLSLLPYRKLAGLLDRYEPDCIHIATEGPLGLAGRRYCEHRKLSFTTSYHTQFPEYIRSRAPIPLDLSYAFLRRHHGAARRTLVATEHQRQILLERGFEDVVIWSRGVDTEVFAPTTEPLFRDLTGPIWLYAGRVSVEKNLEAFLELNLGGTKVVVGDGPALETLKMRYSNAHFCGYRFGEELAHHMASADVFVFPSTTDTFGLVMLEAMACGTPVAAYPVTGPIDVVIPGKTGVLAKDLREACLQALSLNRDDCREHALSRTWAKATEQFLNHMVLARSGNDVADGAQLSLAAAPATSGSSALS